MDLREQFGTLPFSTHAIAALLLYEQPFGFTHQDVTDEDEVSEYCAVMAAQNHEAGDTATAAKFELLGGRHRERARRIAEPPVLAGEFRRVGRFEIDGSAEADGESGGKRGRG